jgi:lycopene cyclase domain-containing protein
VADWIAIGKGIWFFDEEQITGWKIRGVMPWEEAAFFYVTSLLVAQTFLILLPAGLR